MSTVKTTRSEIALIKKALIIFIACAYATQLCPLLLFLFTGLIDLEKLNIDGNLAYGFMVLSGVLFVMFAAVAALTSAILLFMNFGKIRQSIYLQHELNKLTLMLKLLLIPFFVINFVSWSVFLMALFMMSLAIAAIGSFLTYCFIIPSSVFAISGLYAQYKQRKLSAESLALHTILQLIPVLDVIDYLWVYYEINKHTAQRPVYQVQPCK
jgi:hypothetical protein